VKGKEIFFIDKFLLRLLNSCCKKTTGGFVFKKRQTGGDVGQGKVTDSNLSSEHKAKKQKAIILPQPLFLWPLKVNLGSPSYFFPA
jgi:hypothetical protein